MSNKEKNLDKLNQDQKGKTAGGIDDPDPREVTCPGCGYKFIWTPGEPWRCPSCGGWKSK